jgi:ferredoxin
MVMSTEIYYFSGTGNSLVVARDIAAKMNGRLTPIPSVIDKDRITTDAGVIGIVFPVYHAVFDGMPLMVKRFINRLADIDSKYIFAVCTCRGWSRVTISKLGDIISTNGGKLSAGFTVPMPDNSSPTTEEERQKLFNNWKKKLEVVYQYVSARKRGKRENTVFYNLIMAPVTSKLEKTTLKLLSKLANSTNLPFEELLPLTDRSFFANEKCNGCGICARVCPASDIEMVNSRPAWQNRCESCLACINWCPREAIQGGITSTDKAPARYVHPDVKVSDFILRK